MSVAFSTISPGLAKAFAPTSTYAKGDFVLYQNKYWKAKNDITVPEAWNVDNWEWIEDVLTGVARVEDFDASSPAEYVTNLVYGEAMADAIEIVVRSIYDDGEGQGYPIYDDASTLNYPHTDTSSSDAATNDNLESQLQ